MKKYILFSLLCITAVRGFSQGGEFRTYYTKAIEAYKAKDYPKFYTFIKQANTDHPYHEAILYQLGLAAALTGHAPEAIDNLTKAVLIQNSFKLEGIADFDAIKNSAEFKKLLLLQKEWAEPIVHSDTAIMIRDRTLHVEGLEFDPATKTFYAGAIHKRKIVKIKDGVETDFCPTAVEGMTSIFGLKIDEKKKILWACSSPMPEMENFDSTFRSAVFKFDLVTGKLLKKFQRPSAEKDGVFGDLTLNKAGDVFISDGTTNMIFKVNEKTNQLEPWYTSDEFWNLQGIAFDENDKNMFIADYIKGLFKLNVESKTLTFIKCDLKVSLKAIDGLLYYKNSLVAIQNGVTPMRVTRYFLNGSKDAITSFDILDRKYPAYNDPTLGVIHDDTFYYIANSQWEGYDEHHALKPLAQLQDVVILKQKLKSKN